MTAIYTAETQAALAEKWPTHTAMLLDLLSTIEQDDRTPAVSRTAAVAQAMSDFLVAGGATPAHTYTLAEIRNGTGFPRGARFAMVPTA